MRGCLLLLLLIPLLLRTASAADILALMVVASHSHHLWNSKYLEALAARGHHVTYFSIDEYPRPPQNITHVFVEGAYQVYDDIDFSEIGSAGPYRTALLLHRWIEQETAHIVQSEGFQELKRVMRRKKFDLVVHDLGGCWFLLGAVDFVGRPPVMAITPFGTPHLALSVLGNPPSYASDPYFLSHYPNTMTLLQRADNFFLHLWSWALDWLFLGKHTDQARASFGPSIRPLDEILDDINIILVNSNPAIDYPFPRVPGLVPVGGLHINAPKPLPQDLKTFLDEADHGAVYFSLGSNIQASALPPQKLLILVAAFARISPVRVLWKWEADSLPNKPPNVKTSKWLPQNDILAHPNVRLFFTHSGLLSTQEAFYHGKPIVGMPFFLDQHVNANKCVKRGLGEKLEWSSLTVEGVVATIERVLTEQKYAENARNSSLIFKDDRESPLERAVYWTEYAIRHRGAPHLRYSSRNLSWHQNRMLDVALVAIGAGCLVLLCVHKVIRVIGGAGGAVAPTRRKPEGKKEE